MEATKDESPSKKVKVSVVIPCYNQGQWLWETIESVLAQDMDDYEVIVVNDGSSDPVTNRIVEEIEHAKVLTVKTENQGLSAARNEGIKRARGDYILPLDSDDRIHPAYLRKAAEVLDKQKAVGIVYCKAELFGEEQGLWDLEPYSFPGILLSPQIFAASMFRKQDWERVGGYSTEMIYGWEDYDFWLSLIKEGVQVHQLGEVLFYYRKTAGSMAGLDRKRMLYSFRKLFDHHKELYEANIGSLFEAVIDSKHVRDLERLNTSDIFEVFIPDQDGYVNRNTREQHYPEDVWTKVSVFLNEVQESGIHLFRLDPSRKTSVVDIESIKLLNAGTDQVVWEANATKGFHDFVMGPNTLQLQHDRCLRIFCMNEDGHFFLPKLDSDILDQPLTLELFLKRHTDLRSLQELIESKAEAIASDAQLSELKQQLSAHESQAVELSAEVERQRKHAEELEKMVKASREKADVFKSETEQAKMLVETLRSEVRQSQEQTRQLAGKLEAAEQQLSSLKTRKQRWFGK